MLVHHIKLMIRGFYKNKLFSVINLLGLATGMAVCLLLVLYIANELGFDQFHERGDQVYRVALERKYPGRNGFKGNIPRSIGQAIKMEFPEVLQTTRVFNYWGTEGLYIKVGDKVFVETKMLAVDSNFFRVFTGRFLYGNANALEKPGTAVITESTAKRYFGSVENAVDKSFKINEFTNCLIAGICEDWPGKSHLQFNVLRSTSGFSELQSPEYVYFNCYTYLLLNQNASAARLEAKLPGMVDKFVAGPVERLFGQSYKQFLKEGNGYRYFLQPLKQIHLTSELEDELGTPGSMRVIIMFGSIGIFILFLACINYINLSTAISVERAREVGIRKTFGSGKAKLTWQFLSESVFFSMFSLVFALLLAYLFLPLLRNITSNELHFTYFFQPYWILAIIGFAIIIGMAAGIYPALVLSSFKPILVLKGRFKSSKYRGFLRNGLVVFQFAVSVILIICTIVVNQQMQFVLGNKLGFRQDHIISLDGLWRLGGVSQKQAFVNEISSIPGVEVVTECDNLPGYDESAAGGTWVTFDKNKTSRTQKTFTVDDKYAALLGLEVKQGRFFSSAFTTDSLGVVLNESAVADFGLENPIGAKLVSMEPVFRQDTGRNLNVFTVIGVVKDYHFQSMLKRVAPLVTINSNKFGWGSAGVRINGDQFKTVLANIEKTWDRFDPKHSIQYSFLDKHTEDLYKTEKTQQRVFTIFSILAIVIACVGLFGLATYSAHQRTREIGISKVLGAMPGSIFMILSRNFLSLVVIASLMAFPVAWWSMYGWLKNFAYRVDISVWVFLLASIIAAVIALLTISYRAIKAATANPVKGIRTE